MRNLLRTCAITLVVSFALGACASSDEPEQERIAEEKVVDTPTPSPTKDYLQAEIEVGVGPGAVATGFGSVWVADHTGATVTRVDPETNEVIETITTAGEPTGISVGYDSVWTYGAIARVVNRIDPDTNKVVAKIKLDTTGGGIVGGAAFDGSMWFPGEEGNVFRVNPATNEVVATIRVAKGICPGNVAAGEGSVWWACEGSLVRIDPASDQVADTYKVGGGANSPMVGAGAVWLALQQGGAVARFDPAAGKVSETVDVGDGVEQLRVSGNDIWVRVDDDELARVDAKSLEVIQMFELPGAQVPGGGITVGFGSVWAVNFSVHTLWRIDPSAGG